MPLAKMPLSLNSIFEVMVSASPSTALANIPSIILKPET